MLRCIAVWLTAAVAVQGTLAMQKLVIMEQMGECEHHSDITYAFQIINTTMHRHSRDSFVLTGNIRVHEIITGNLSNYLLMTKCAVKESPDSCEVYMEAVTHGVCDALKEDGHVWSNFFASMDMDRRCPMKPGLYNLTNAKIDMSMFVKVPTSLGYWKLHGELRNESHVLSCAEGTFEILPLRRRFFRRP